MKAASFSKKHDVCTTLNGVHSKKRWSSFKVCKSVHHHTIPINHPTRCNNFSSLSLDVYVQLNMFRASSSPLSGSRQLQQQPLILPLERGGSIAVGRGRAGRPDHDQQHCYHHSPKVKLEAATAIVVVPDDGHEDDRNMLSSI